MATNQGFKSLIPDKRRADAGYLYWWLRCHRSFMDGLGNGATFKEVSKAVVSRVEIPLPPLDEQRRIAAILDQADELRRSRRSVTSLIYSLRHSVFIEAFGNPTANPSRWPTAPFVSLTRRLTVGIVVKPASYYQDVGVPAIRGTNIKAEGIDLSDAVYFSEEDNAGRLAKTRVWEGDLVIVRSGRPGLAAIVPASLNGANAIDVLIVTPDQSKVRPVFLRDFMNSGSGRRLVLSESRGQVQQHFNVGSLSSTAIYVPPLELQIEYERRLASVEAVQDANLSAASELDALFASLQRRAFTGQLTRADERRLETV